MPIIPINLDDVKEMRPVPVGKYSLEIVGCEEVLTKKGKPQYEVSIAIEGHDDAPLIRHYISLPSEGDEPNAMRYKALLLKRFCSMFGHPLSGQQIDTAQIAMRLVGARAVGEVLLERETDSDGNEKPGGRVFNRLNVPPISDEAPGRAVAGQKR